MPRQFSAEFGNRLAQARIHVVDENNEFTNALSTVEGTMQALSPQLRQLEVQCKKSSRILDYLLEDEKIEDFERLKQYYKEFQDILAEEDSKFDRHVELLERYGESLSRTERRFTVLWKRQPIITKLQMTLERIDALNTIADEEVSIQRIQTENASDETDGESTTVEMVERKISSEVDDGGSTMETVEDFSTDGKLSVAMIEEQRSSEVLAGESSEEKLGEVKKSSLALDSTERVTKLSLLFQELEELLGELEMAKKEFLEL